MLFRSLKACTLPLTGARVVNMVITDLGVFEIDVTGKGGVTMAELAPGISVDEARAKTQATMSVSPKLIQHNA